MWNNRGDFIVFLELHHLFDAKLQCGLPNSLNYYTAYQELVNPGFTSSPAEKLAELLLSWYPENGHSNG